MANFSNGPAQLSTWINSSLAQLDKTQEMLIVPLAGINSLEQLMQCLLLLNGYSPVRGNGEISILSPGVIRLNAVRTVDDAIAELEGPMVSISLLNAAINCIATEAQEGKTTKVTTMMGELLIDRQALALAHDLPLESEEETLFTVFAPQVSRRPGDDKRMLVVVRGTPPDTKSTSSASLDNLLERLEERSKSNFENIAQYDLEGIDNIWDLFTHSHFNDVLSLLRGGYTHTIRRQNDHLVISY